MGSATSASSIRSERPSQPAAGRLAASLSSRCQPRDEAPLISVACPRLQTGVAQIFGWEAHRRAASFYRLRSQAITPTITTPVTMIVHGGDFACALAVTCEGGEMSMGESDSGESSSSSLYVMRGG